MPNCEVRVCPNFKFRRNESNIGVRFHRFPLDAEYRWKWEEWVRKLNGVDQFVAQLYTFLCSHHFTRECYMPSMALRRKVVPSIIPVSTEGDSENTYKVVTLDEVDFPAALLDVSNILPVPSVPQCKDETIIIPDDGSDSEEILSCAMSTTPKRNRLAFIGDITVADLTSPQRAEKSLALIHDNYHRMQARIKVLQKALRRAKARILQLELLKLESSKMELETTKIELETAKMALEMERIKKLAA